MLRVLLLTNPATAGNEFLVETLGTAAGMPVGGENCVGGNLGHIDFALMKRAIRT
jgi:hypothetical protein